MRTFLAHAGKQGRRVVVAFVTTAFAQEDGSSPFAQWRQVADQLRSKLPNLAAIMDKTLVGTLPVSPSVTALICRDILQWPT